jgi:hypothetical protein
MPRRGSWDMRNADHKQAQASLFAAAQDPDEMLTAAFGWFRSSAAFLARRQTPKGTGREVNRQAAGRVKREMALQLKALAEAVDRGDYDAGR